MRGLTASMSFRDDPKGDGSGIHEHMSLEYGFRARRCATPRNDETLRKTAPEPGGVLLDPVRFGLSALFLGRSDRVWDRAGIADVQPERFDHLIRTGGAAQG